MIGSAHLILYVSDQDASTEFYTRLLGDRLPDPAAAAGIPRAELYLFVSDPARYHARALECGASELSEPAPRGWGDVAAYVLDPDGHVLAFARRG